MAYVKRTWIARAGTFLNRFIKANETTTSVDLTNDPATITEAGTPFTVDAMNNIEDGIQQALDQVETGTDLQVAIYDGTKKVKAGGTLLSTITSAISTLQGYFTAGVANNSLDNNTGYIASGDALTQVYDSPVCNGQWLINTACTSIPTAGFWKFIKTGWGNDNNNYAMRIVAKLLNSPLDHTEYEAIYAPTGWGGWVWVLTRNADGSVPNASHLNQPSGVSGVYTGAALYSAIIAFFGTGSWDKGCIGGLSSAGIVCRVTHTEGNSHITFTYIAFNGATTGTISITSADMGSYNASLSF